MTRRTENELNWYLEHMHALKYWCRAAKEEWEERAAILEHDEGIPRMKAENKAFLMVLERWKNKNILGGK